MWCYKTIVVVYEYTETQRNKTQNFIYLFIYCLFNDTFCSSEYNPKQYLIPDNDFEKVNKEAVVAPFVVRSQNFPAMSEENNENPNWNSWPDYLPNTKQQ